MIKQVNLFFIVKWFNLTSSSRCFKTKYKNIGFKKVIKNDHLSIFTNMKNAKMLPNINHKSPSRKGTGKLC